MKTLRGDDSNEQQRLLEEFWKARGPMGEKFTHEEGKLQKSLAKYDPYSAASLLAALLTFPQLQENQYRIEYLQLTVLRFCRGKQKLSYKRLGELLNEDCPDYVKHQEDPLEDVYVSTTGDSKGEYLIFEGLFEENAFFLQELLEVLNVRPPPASETILEKIRALLRVSHRTVKECGLTRWEVGLANAKSDVPLPPEKQLRTRAKLLTLGHHSPILNIDDAGDIEHFIKHYKNIDNESFPRHPIIQFRNKKLLLAHPSAISIAARAYAIEQFEANETLEVFQETLRLRRKHYLQEEYFQRKLGIQRTDFAIITDNGLQKNRVDEALVEYDAGHNAYFLFLSDNLAGYKAKDTYRFVSPPSDLQSLIQERITTITTYCNEVLKTEVGILAIVMCGFGRGISFGINDLPENWLFLPLSLADIETLRDDGKNDLVHLTRYLIEKKKAEEKEIVIGTNFSGFLNEYAFWKGSDYNLIPLDHETKSKSPLMLSISPNYLAENRIENRKSRNLHYVKYKDNEYYPVSRFEQYSFFKEDRDSPIYVSSDAVRNGHLLAVIETESFTLWIQTTANGTTGTLHRFVYDCWKTALYSIARARNGIGKALSPMKSEPIRLFLDFSNLAGVDSLQEILRAKTESLRIGTSNKELRANISIPKGFLPQLAQPENEGEKYFISAIVECLSKLLHSKVGHEISSSSHEGILQEVFPNKDARQMHFFMNMSDIDYIVNTSLDPDDLFLVPQSEKSSLHCNLTWSVDKNATDGPLRAKSKCNSLLQKAAYSLFLKIVEELKTVNTEALITLLLENIEIAHLEDTRWSNTSRAVLATHKDKGEALNTVAKIKFRRTEAATTSRILIELALCPMNSNYEKPPSKIKLGRLLAHTSEMLSLASQADAIHLNMAKPGVLVRKNGAIHILDEARDSTTYHYLNDSITDAYEIDEEEYEAFYATEEKEKHPSIDEIDLDFASAFEAEYGFSVTTFRDIFSTFLDLAYEKEKAVIRIERSELESRILTGHGIDAEKLDTFLNRFAFKPRNQWESDDERSNKPWLLQRKYSLTLQPFILLPECDGKPERIFYGIQSIERSLRYVLSSLGEGWQEESVLESKEAKEYVGAISHAKGREFEKDVRDKIRNLGLSATDEIFMRTLGAPESLGDIDTVVWEKHERKLYLIECKRLKFSRTPREIASQLLKFTGDKSNSDDLLGKHLKRMDWLNQNTSKLLDHLGLEEDNVELVPIVATNRIVPMQYRESMPIPKEQFVYINRIEKLFNGPSRD